MMWWRKPEQIKGEGSSTLDRIERQLDHLYQLAQDPTVRHAPDWIVKEISKLNSALIQQVSEKRIAKLITEDEREEK